MKRVVIIGAGISGLSAAHHILERRAELPEPISVVIVEAGPRAGGIIKTEERDGFLLEHGPDAFITEKPHAMDLARGLGLESRFLTTNANHRRSFIVSKGRLLPIPEGFGLIAPSRMWPFITSDIFTWRGKARIAMDLLLRRGGSNGESDESLASFVQRRLGREALERLAQPMIGGIYTADPATLSLQATMPRFLEMERQHRSLILALRKNTNDKASTSGARYDLFLSFDKGLQLLTDTLVDRISASVETTISLNCKALSLHRTSDGSTANWRIETTAGPVIADGVCLALPAFHSAGLLKDIDATLGSELNAIPYASSVTINLAFKRSDVPHPLDGFGFVVPFMENRTLMACTFSSVKFAGRAPEGSVLLRAFVGGALQPDLVELSDAELLARVSSDLRDLLGIQVSPLFHDLYRWRHSMPQYLVGHTKRVERIERRAASLPCLTLAGNAYSGLGIPDCVRSGETAAAQLLEQLSLTH
jgi:protoporphyrinogen/coproporphyrinogen III oxidase